MALDADVYLDRIKFEKYCRGETCDLCRVATFSELVQRLESGGVKNGPCPHWPEWKVKAFQQAAQAGLAMPAVPSLDVPRPAAPGALELNLPEQDSPVLVTGNSELTQAVVLAVLSTTLTPLRLVSVDTMGHTVDMAMVFKEMKPEKIRDALAPMLLDSALPRVILPGLAATIAPALEELLEREVETGPVCAAELPLYMGEEWIPA